MDDLPRLHAMADHDYGVDGAEVLLRLLEAGADPNERAGALAETPLHVATRRRRPDAVELLLAHGADIEARTAGGKTAWLHAVRRGFADVTAVLEARGADTRLAAPDRLAVAVVEGRLDAARALLAAEPGCVRTGNPEEDRLLADVAGRFPTVPVALLIEAGADLAARGLDDGTPLHQAAWFGQPANAWLLVAAGAPLDVFDGTHASSPIGWAVHGSRYSGGADVRQDEYVALVQLLLEAGSSLRYPGEESDAYRERLLRDATPDVRALLESS